MFKLFKITVLFALAVFTYSCNSCSNKNTKDVAMLDFESISVIDSIDAVFYALPSPEEIITYINDHSVRFEGKLLHNYKHAKLYTNQTKKTLMCGVYFADLAYISAFKKSDISPDYIATVDYLLSELNINPNFTKEQKEKVIDASMEPDSLYSISRELYDTIISYLQEYDDGKTLSLLSVGSIIESLYITTHLNQDITKQKDAINRIAEQKLLFEDVTTMITTYKDDKEVGYLLEDLMVLKKSFENLNIQNEVGEVKNEADGSIFIGGKSEFDITEENYYIFCDNIQDIRTKLIRTQF